MTRSEFYNEAVLRMMQAIVSDPTWTDNQPTDDMIEAAISYAKKLTDAWAENHPEGRR